MKEAIIVLQCYSNYQVETILRCLDMFGYVWGGTKKSLIEFKPYSLGRSNGKVNIIVCPEGKSVRYNFSKYAGLADIDNVNYVLKVIE